MWIHQHRNWPNFTWNFDALASKLADIRYRQGRLLGRLEGLGIELEREANLITLTNDIVKSSAIEEEHLNSAEVRSSIARRLGIESAEPAPVNRDVEGVVEMMLDATGGFSNPMTKERLFDWHSALFPSGRSGIRRITVGGWRTVDADPMRVVSGPIGHEKVHFEAPNAKKLEAEMSSFLTWFENPDGIDPVIVSGIAHFWFVTIHPFEDGNGRIARAIGDLALARADGTPSRVFSLSTQIEFERNDYYAQIERQQRGTPDLTVWLEWFLGCIGRAISGAAQTLSNVLFKARLWDMIGQNSVNERQRLIINRMLEENFKGNMKTSKYSKMAKCSNDTALRDIQDLTSRGVFIKNPGGGRSSSYRLTDAVGRSDSFFQAD